MAYTRESQRTVTCPKCHIRDSYWWTSEDGARRLMAADGVTPHTCGTAAQPVASATAPKAEAPKAFDVDTAPSIRESIPTPVAVEWSEASALRVPAKYHLTRYVPRKMADGRTDLETLEALYRANAEACAKGERPVNVLLISDTGAGKSHLARALAARLGVPFLRVPLNGGANVESLVGKANIRAVNGVMVSGWDYGELALACKDPRGAVVMLDELNAITQSLGPILHPVLDDDRLMVIADKPESFVINPKVFFIAAINPDYAGTKPLSPALESRFDVPLYLDYEPNVEKKLIHNDALLNLAKALRAQYRAGDGTVNVPVSTRMLLAYERNLSLVGEGLARDAFLSVFRRDPEEYRAVSEAFALHMEKKQALDVDKDVNLDEPARF